MTPFPFSRPFAASLRFHDDRTFFFVILAVLYGLAWSYTTVLHLYEAGWGHSLGQGPGEAAGGQQLCLSAVGQAFFSSLRCSLVESHRRKVLWPVPKNCTKRENMQDGIRGDGNFIGFGLQQNKTTISLSVSKTLMPERKFFPPACSSNYVLQCSPPPTMLTPSPWTQLCFCASLYPHDVCI